MLYHALSEKVSNPFIYTMSTVKSAFNSIKTRIEDESIFNMEKLFDELGAVDAK